MFTQSGRMNRVNGAGAAVALLAAALTLADVQAVYRSIEGEGDAAAGGAFAYVDVPPAYSDGEAGMTDLGGPGARVVSNMLFGSGPFALSDMQVSHMHAAFGQFIAHDVAMTVKSTTERADIPVPMCDAYRDTACEGDEVMAFFRLQHADGSGDSDSNPRRPVNAVTGMLDASVVYGSSDEIAALLRTGTGGRLKSHPFNGVPPNDVGAPMVGGPFSSAAQMLAGDARANVNPGILSVHGLFVLEHNRQCELLAAEHADWDDETLYQEARQRVIAVYQRITLYEYYPLVLGETPPPYDGYDDLEDPAVDVFFAVAAFRYGHSAVNSVYTRLNEDGSPSAAGHLLLRESYFAPAYLDDVGGKGIAPIIRGLITQVEQEVDLALVDDLREFLEGVNGDLAAIDVQRGRDVGLPSYGDAREAFGLSRPESFNDVSSDADVVAALELAYPAGVQSLDAWVGGLAEDKVRGGMVGPLFAASVRQQFLRFRSADPFWYERAGVLDADARAAVDALSFADIIELNGITDDAGAPFRVSGGVATAAAGSLQVVPELLITWEPVGADDDEVEFTVTLQGTGFVGLGIGSTMADADVTIAYVAGSAVVVEDRVSTDHEEPVLDRSQSVTLVQGSEQGGVTTVTFRRPLAAADSEDRAISREEATNIIVAWDTELDTLGFHGDNRAQAVINVADGSSATSSSSASTLAFNYSKVFIIHGALQFLAWGVMVPLAIFVVRYRKHRPYWLELHRFLMSGVVLITALSSSLAVMATPGSVGKFHHILGITVASVAVLQAVIGALVRFWHTSFVPPLRYVMLRRVHRWLGRTALIVSLVTCGAGVQLLSDGLQYAVIAWSCLLLEGFVWAELQRRKAKRDAPDRVSSRKAHIHITQAEFTKQVAHGAQWVLLGNVVFDVSKFIPVHPGGTYLLSRAVGQDVESYFFGRAQIDSQGETHTHSKHAHRILRSMVRGTLIPAGEGDDGGEAFSPTDAAGARTVRSGDGSSKGDRASYRVAPGGLMVSPATRVYGSSTDITAEVAVRGRDGVVAKQLPAAAKKLLLGDGAENVDETRETVWTLVSQQKLTSSKRPTYALVLAPPPDEAAIPFTPLAFGRHMMVIHSRDHRATGTPYTITRWGVRNNDLEKQWPGAMTLIVRRYPHGFASRQLSDMMMGESVVMSGPRSLGLNLTDRSATHVVAFACGTGITPFVDLIQFIVEIEERGTAHDVYEPEAAGGAGEASVVEGLPPIETRAPTITVAQRRLNISLLACYGDGDDMLLHDWLEDMRKRSNGRFRYVANLKSGSPEWQAEDPKHRSIGRVGEEEVGEFVEKEGKDSGRSQFWVCGTPDFKRSIAHLHLPAVGVSAAHVHSL